MKVRTLRLIEFAVVGVVMGTGEDLLAVFLATDAEFSWKILWVVFMVALPFAFISEIIVDHPRFWSKIFKNITHGDEQKIHSDGPKPSP
ncbi:MAG: hypothetical protein Q8P88_01035 [Candidatus Jorgensenbacteria bacterium]|nr:hypothetical protein [Candidatus Jorgensenbacteria bacterium]